MRVYGVFVLLALVSVIAVACGGDDGAVGTIDGSTTMVAADHAPITEDSATTPATAPSVTTTTPLPSASSTPPTVAPPRAPSADGSDLPGEPSDIHPRAGAVLGVVGVAHDDVLNVREFPGLTAIVARLAPTSDDVVAAGEGRLLASSIWWKITAAGTTGWINSAFVAHFGPVDDLTSSAITRLGSHPTAATMELLGWTVADAFASDDPPSTIVMSVAPAVGDLGEVTYDVVGIGDDSQAGWRLHVFGAPEGGGFVLKSVEATALCAPGRHRRRLHLTSRVSFTPQCGADADPLPTGAAHARRIASMVSM